MTYLATSSRWSVPNAAREIRALMKAPRALYSRQRGSSRSAKRRSYSAACSARMRMTSTSLMTAAPWLPCCRSCWRLLRGSIHPGHVRGTQMPRTPPAATCAARTSSVPPANLAPRGAPVRPPGTGCKPSRDEERPAGASRQLPDPSHDSEDPVSGSDIVIGTHRVRAAAAMSCHYPEVIANGVPAVRERGDIVLCAPRRRGSGDAAHRGDRSAWERALSADPSGPGARMSTVQPGSEPPADTLGPTVLRMILGNQLHRFREAAGVTPEAAGYEIRASRSKISRMENGRVAFKERDVADLLTLYGITDEQMRAGMVSLVRQANTPGWWSKYGDVLSDWFEAYLGLETAASVIRTFELQFVHGLFQTEAYARAVTLLGHTAAPAEEIDRRVSLRLKRQDLLTGPEPPQVWSVIDEGALRRPVGGRSVMRAQLNRLIEVAELRHVTIQVVPFGRGGHAAAGGSFTILRFEDADVPDVVYIEQLTSALYLDKRDDVDHYMEVMNHLSTQALTPALTARFLAEITRET